MLFGVLGTSREPDLPVQPDSVEPRAAPMTEPVVQVAEEKGADDGSRQESAAQETERRSAVGRPEAPPEEPGDRWTLRLVGDVRTLAGNGIAAEVWLADQLLATSAADGTLDAQVLVSPKRLQARMRKIPDVLHFRAVEGGHRLGKRVSTSLESGATNWLGTVVLRGEGRIEGRVLDREGRPLANRRVSWLPPDRPKDVPVSLAVQEGGQSAPSDADGRFVLPRMPEGLVTLCVLGGGNAELREVEVRASGTVSVELVAASNTWVVFEIPVRVVTPEGTPLSGAVVVSASSDIRRSDPPRSNDDGRLVVTHHGSRPPVLVATDPRQNYTASTPLDVDPETIGTEPVVLQLQPADAITVRVVDASGTPIPWSNVFLQGSGASEPVPCGEDGVVSLLRPSRTFRAKAFAPGFQTGSFGPLVPDALPDPLDLRLEPGGFVRGVVRLRGRPVSGARVCVVPIPKNRKGYAISTGVTDPQTPFVFDHALPFVPGEGLPFSVTTDAEGRFLADIHQDGPQALCVEAEGIPAQIHAVSDWSPTGTFERDVDLLPPGRLIGRLRLPPGERIEGRCVGVSAGDGLVHVVRTDAEGAYRFDALSPADYQVRLCRPPIASVQRVPTSFSRSNRPRVVDCTVRSGETSVFDLELGQRFAVTLHGTLTLRGAVPSTPVEQVALWSPKRLEPLQFADLDDGAFTFQVYEPGTYGLALGFGRTRYAREVELALGENHVDLDLELGELIVRLGAEPAQEDLRLTSEDRLGGRSLVFLEDSRAKLRALGYGAAAKVPDPMRILFPIGSAALRRPPSEGEASETGVQIGPFFGGERTFAWPIVRSVSVPGTLSLE